MLASISLVDALSERPADEPVWTSLRHVLDVMTGYVVDERRRGRAEVMQAIIDASPQLTARYLAIQAAWQALLTDVVRHRLGRPGRLRTVPVPSPPSSTTRWARSDSRSAAPGPRQSRRKTTVLCTDCGVLVPVTYRDPTVSPLVLQVLALVGGARPRSPGAG